MIDQKNEARIDKKIQTLLIFLTDALEAKNYAAAVAVLRRALISEFEINSNKDNKTNLEK